MWSAFENRPRFRAAGRYNRFLAFVMLVASPIVERALAQTPEWVNLTNGDFVTGLGEDGQSVWASTNGGLVQIDKLGRQRTYHTRANSGLTNNPLRAIHVAPNGDVWLALTATQRGYGGGVARFDGDTWTIYDSDNSPLLFGAAAFATDGKGDTWIGTYGLLRFDGTDWTTYDSSDYGLDAGYGSEGWVATILVDFEGNIWIGVPPKYVFHAYRGGGLARFDGEKWTAWTSLDSELPSNYVTSLGLDQDGSIWIGTLSYYGEDATGTGGVTRFDGSTWVSYDTTNSGLPSDLVRSVVVDSDGTKCIGTDAGVAEFDGTDWTVYNSVNSPLPSDDIGPMLASADGDLWVGTRDAGVARFDGNDWTLFDTSNSPMPANHWNSNGWAQFQISALTLGPRGAMWMGLNGGGLVHVLGQTWTVYNTENSGLPADRVSAIAFDANDDLWIGTTGGGVAHFDRTNWTIYDTSNSGLPGNTVSSIAVDDTGTVWIGALNIFGGFSSFDGSNWVVYTTDNSDIPYNIVSAVAIDLNGDVLAGSGGVVRFDGTQWTPLGGPSSVQSMRLDNSGNIWVGGIREGLGMYDGANWTFYHTSNSGLPANYVPSLAFDSDGSLWIGTCGGGVAHFDGAIWDVFNWANSGISDDYCIHSIAVDRNGNTWIGHQNGALSIYEEGGIVTAVEQDADGNGNSPLPPVLRVASIPKPCGPITIRYSIGTSRSRVRLAVYDVRGRLVRLLQKGAHGPGEYSLSWDWLDEAGRTVVRGVYFVHLDAGDVRATRKLVLLYR